LFYIIKGECEKAENTSNKICRTGISDELDFEIIKRYESNISFIENSIKSISSIDYSLIDEKLLTKYYKDKLRSEYKAIEIIIDKDIKLSSIFILGKDMKVGNLENFKPVNYNPSKSKQITEEINKEISKNSNKVIEKTYDRQAKIQKQKIEDKKQKDIERQNEIKRQEAQVKADKEKEEIERFKKKIRSGLLPQFEHESRFPNGRRDLRDEIYEMDKKDSKYRSALDESQKKDLEIILKERARDIEYMGQKFNKLNEKLKEWTTLFELSPRKITEERKKIAEEIIELWKTVEMEILRIKRITENIYVSEGGKDVFQKEMNKRNYLIIGKDNEEKIISVRKDAKATVTVELQQKVSVLKSKEDDLCNKQMVIDLKNLLQSLYNGLISIPTVEKGIDAAELVSHDKTKKQEQERYSKIYEKIISLQAKVITLSTELSRRGVELSENIINSLNQTKKLFLKQQITSKLDWIEKTEPPKSKNNAKRNLLSMIEKIGGEESLRNYFNLTDEQIEHIKVITGLTKTDRADSTKTDDKNTDLSSTPSPTPSSSSSSTSSLSPSLSSLASSLSPQSPPSPLTPPNDPSLSSTPQPQLERGEGEAKDIKDTRDDAEGAKGSSISLYSVKKQPLQSPTSSTLLSPLSNISSNPSPSPLPPPSSSSILSSPPPPTP
jgi:hypothetical protein